MSLVSLIQCAIKKTLDACAPALQHHLDSLTLCHVVKNASDESIEHMSQSGEVALHRCFLARFYRSPLTERPCGSFKVTTLAFLAKWTADNLQTIALQVLSGTTLAVLVAKSDLEAEGISERAGPEVIRIIFGVLALRIDEQQLQRSFDDLFDPVLRAAQAAYIAYHEKKTNSAATTRPRNFIEGDLVRTERFTLVRTSFSHLQSNSPATAQQPQLTLGPALQALTRVKDFASREVEEFMGIAKGLPVAFITGFKSGLSPPDPLNANLGSRSCSRTSPKRASQVTPHRPKPYSRASAPSPPSPERRMYRATRPLSIPPRRVRFSEYDSEPTPSGLHPIPRRVYSTLSTPLVFASSGPNRTLVLNTAPSSRI
ncbi:hypothetical protein C8R45DRAFT_1218920 [Mycena sanguinolenta]|nr:hypothetical protein C8R45DRAFT_1218920 [Mycena sanguinolenta]